MKYAIALVISIVFCQIAIANENDSVGNSKTVICMDASVAAAIGFEEKLSNQKMTLFKTNHKLHQALVNKAYVFGYKNAKSQKEAFEKGFANCIESNLWKK